jgi:hypothetical protein
MFGYYITLTASCIIHMWAFFIIANKHRHVIGCETSWAVIGVRGYRLRVWGFSAVRESRMETLVLQKCTYVKQTLAMEQRPWHEAHWFGHYHHLPLFNDSFLRNRNYGQVYVFGYKFLIFFTYQVDGDWQLHLVEHPFDMRGGVNARVMAKKHEETTYIKHSGQ